MSNPHVAEVDVSSVAALIADRARQAMLHVLMDGRCRTAGELARAASVQPATASSQLSKLSAGGLVVVKSQGRHRYFRLAGPAVATAFESLAFLAPATPVTSLRQDRQVKALAEARTCYDLKPGATVQPDRQRALTVEFDR
jgi:DNA-binding transcriptional ArsR family regulator